MLPNLCKLFCFHSPPSLFVNFNNYKEANLIILYHLEVILVKKKGILEEIEREERDYEVGCPTNI